MGAQRFTRSPGNSGGCTRPRLAAKPALSGPNWLRLNRDAPRMADPLGSALCHTPGSCIEGPASMDDLPRGFVIRESSHRIHNPFTSEKLATLGRALYLSPGTSVLDLACGSGEMLCTWARDYRLTGTGVDISTAFIGAARARAIELDVADRVTFIHGDAAGYVAERPVGVASCIGATWIGDGVAGTVELLRRSLSPGGIMLVGEPYWRREPPIRPPSKVATGPAMRIGSRCRS